MVISYVINSVFFGCFYPLSPPVLRSSLSLRIPLLFCLYFSLFVSKIPILCTANDVPLRSSRGRQIDFFFPPAPVRFPSRPPLRYASLTSLVDY